MNMNRKLEIKLTNLEVVCIGICVRSNICRSVFHFFSSLSFLPSPTLFSFSFPFSLSLQSIFTVILIHFPLPLCLSLFSLSQFSFPLCQVTFSFFCCVLLPLLFPTGSHTGSFPSTYFTPWEVSLSPVVSLWPPFCFLSHFLSLHP